MRDRTCFVSADIEHDLGTADSKTFLGIEEIDALLDIFKKFRVPATLFVTGDILERFSERVKEWSRTYEIASHSYSHIYFNELSDSDKEEDIKKFVGLYRDIFGEGPRGFRAPSHVIDNFTINLLRKYSFRYDSSVVPHYPPMKKYRGYSGRASLAPYKKGDLVEIPVAGQLMGIPLVGAWIKKLPVAIYKALFIAHKPNFVTLSMHSWDILDVRFAPKLLKILEILKKNDYVFKSGEQITIELSSIEAS